MFNILLSNDDEIKALYKYTISVHFTKIFELFS